MGLLHKVLAKLLFSPLGSSRFETKKNQGSTFNINKYITYLDLLLYSYYIHVNVYNYSKTSCMVKLWTFKYCIDNSNYIPPTLPIYIPTHFIYSDPTSSIYLRQAKKIRKRYRKKTHKYVRCCVSATRSLAGK